MPLIPAFPHTFIDGPGHTASGEEVMDNLALLRDSVNDKLTAGAAVLPGSAADEQVFNLEVEDGVCWSLRYHEASALPHRWEFIGGGALHRVQDFVIVANLGVDAAPEITIPQDGIYDIAYGHRTWFSTDGLESTQLELRNEGVPVAGDPKIIYQAVRAGSDLKVTESAAVSAELVAGALRLWFSSSDLQGRSEQRWIRVTPKALS